MEDKRKPVFVGSMKEFIETFGGILEIPRVGNLVVYMNGGKEDISTVTGEYIDESTFVHYYTLENGKDIVRFDIRRIATPTDVAKWKLENGKSS